jgi:predicted phage terminase large subunit-like protein
MIKRGAVKTRIYPATKNGQADGEPVLLTREALTEKRMKQGSYTFGCQMLQNPKADEVQGFQEDWLKFYKNTNKGKGMNIVIIVDPANEKKKKSDYTSIKVIGFAEDQNIYVLDMVRDKLNLTERTDKLFKLHKEWKQPNQRLPVYYEKYGKDSDIEHIEYVMDEKNYHFDIHAVGGSMSKNDRIRRLIPDFENGIIYLPEKLPYKDYEGRTRDLVRIFIDEEYLPFPVSEHDDMLDDLARIKDISYSFPIEKPKKKRPHRATQASWMGA